MMKNQSDMIAIIVAGVLTLGCFIAFLLLKRDPVVLSAPTEVVTTAAPLPAGDVVMANSLPAGGGGGGGAGRGRGGPGMGGMGAGKASFMGGVGGGRGMAAGAGGSSGPATGMG